MQRLKNLRTRDWQRLSAIVCFVAAYCSLAAGHNSSVNSAEKEPNPVRPFEAKTFVANSGLNLGYQLLSPQQKIGKKYPLVLFLHGAGERGDDNQKQLVHVAQELATPELQKQNPCFVVAPQCPEGQRWVEVDWGLSSHKMPEVPSEPLSATLELIEQLQKDLPIDSSRIYICGLSMGGFGTWDAVQRQPERFAAAVSICGGGDPSQAERLRDVPVWVFHGDADGAVKVSRSREMVQALQSLGGKVIYTEYPGVGHNSWKMTAENRLVWDWMFAQSKQKD